LFPLLTTSASLHLPPRRPLPSRNSTPEFTNKVITLWYRPPELLLGATKYGTAVDIWSAGCILAELMLGKPLFCGKKEMEQLQLIFGMLGTPTPESWEGIEELKLIRTKEVELSAIERKPRLREKYQEKMPHFALNLLEKLLELDPKKRLTADRALDSRYFNSEPFAPERPEDLGAIQLEGGHFHEFQTKKKRKEAKKIAEQARQNALEMGQTERDAQAEFDACYRGIMERVAQEGLNADSTRDTTEPASKEEQPFDHFEKVPKEKPEKKRSSRERDKDRERPEKKARDERKDGNEREREKDNRRRSDSDDEKRRKRKREEKGKERDEEATRDDSFIEGDKVVASSAVDEAKVKEEIDSSPPVANVANSDRERDLPVVKLEEPRVSEAAENDDSPRRRRARSHDEKDSKRSHKGEKRRSKSGKDRHKDRGRDERRRRSRDRETDREKDRERERRDRFDTAREDFSRGVSGPGYDRDYRQDRGDRDMRGVGRGVGGPGYGPERNRDWDYHDRNMRDRSGPRDGLSRATMAPRGEADFRDFGPRGTGELLFRPHGGPNVRGVPPPPPRMGDDMGAYGPGGSVFRGGPAPPPVFRGGPAPPRESGPPGHYGDIRRHDRMRSPPRMGDRGTPVRRR
jgi:serine/threonine protein kinase